jgi:hypothetical protein
MTRRILGLGFALCTILSVGCSGGGTGSGATFSCNLPADSFCYDWTSVANLTSAQVTQLQTACTNAGGTFGNGSACPSANRVGTCSVTNSTGVAGLNYDYRFYSPTYTAATGQQFCTSLPGGVWTAG